MEVWQERGDHLDPKVRGHIPLYCQNSDAEFTGPAGPPGGGVYTHWGRTTCPNIQGTERVYEGRIVGSRWDQAGSSNYLCLHSNLELHHYIPGVQTDRAYLYDTRYQIDDIPPAFGHLHSRDIPCAVCYSSGRVQPPSLSLGEHLVLPHGQQNTLAT